MIYLDFIRRQFKSNLPYVFAEKKIYLGCRLYAVDMYVLLMVSRSKTVCIVYVAIINFQ